MNERILTATNNLAKAMFALVRADKKLDVAQRHRTAASVAVRIATEQIRGLREEINNPV